METIEYRTVDKSGWGDGAWREEPDKVQWPDAETGLPCLALRHPGLGHWCGYVGVPPGHPLHGVDYDAADGAGDVHGGLTFAGDCVAGDASVSLCHIPAAGEPDHVWCLGFDCAHWMDKSPGTDALLASLPSPRTDARRVAGGVYRTLDYVKAECARLARQVADLA